VGELELAIPCLSAVAKRREIKNLPAFRIAEEDNGGVLPSFFSKFFITAASFRCRHLSSAH
jgi:hypothetical protein